VKHEHREMPMEPRSEGVELREITAALKRGWYLIAGAGVLGLLAGYLVLVGVRPQYEARTLLLIRSQVTPSQGALTSLTGLLGGGGSGSSTLDTEIALLQSRTVVGAVVDSLGLQVEVLEPDATAALELFSRIDVAPDARAAEYRFEREGLQYRVSGGGTVAPGGELRLPDASLALRSSGLPASFTILIRDRETAVTSVEEGVEVGVSQGDAVDVSVRAGEPEMSAAVLNQMVREYLLRRKTSDRGVNQHRYEFLAAHIDTIRNQLATAEAELRVEQERSGVIDPEASGEAELTRAMEVQAELETADIEARAIAQILQRGAGSSQRAREVAAYPSLLSNGAVVDIYSRLMELETERSKLLGTKTERDPEVVAYGETIATLEGQLAQLAQDYLAGLTRRRQQLAVELERYRGVLGALPQKAEESYRRAREVERLSETLVTVQSQLVQARLDALTEGGDVRQIDPAIPPKSPVFPNPLLTLSGGTLGGLFFGMIAAVAFGRRRQRVSEPWEVEAVTGLPAVVFDPRLPLTFPDRAGERVVLVVPLGTRASPLKVAEHIARVDSLQGRNPVLAELGGASPRVPAPAAVPVLADGTPIAERGDGLTVMRDGYAHYPASPGAAPAGARVVLETLEERFSRIVAVLPGLESRETISVLDGNRPTVLVLRAGELSRDALETRVKLCRQLDLRILGVVVVPKRRRNAEQA
jgi:uncharacterized protein involved in exopolysaccharide biosynthesis